MCYEMADDLVWFDILNRKFPGKFVSVRFEDLALDPYFRGEQLYNEIGIDWTPDVIKFIKTHMEVNIDTKLTKHPYSTYRNSQSVPFAWLTKLTWSQIDTIQHECDDVMQKLGYKKITREFYESTADFNSSDVIANID